MPAPVLELVNSLIPYGTPYLVGGALHMQHPKDWDIVLDGKIPPTITGARNKFGGYKLDIVDLWELDNSFCFTLFPNKPKTIKTLLRHFPFNVDSAAVNLKTNEFIGVGKYSNLELNKNACINDRMQCIERAHKLSKRMGLEMGPKLKAYINER